MPQVFLLRADRVRVSEESDVWSFPIKRRKSVPRPRSLVVLFDRTGPGIVFVRAGRLVGWQTGDGVQVLRVEPVPEFQPVHLREVAASLRGVAEPLPATRARKSIRHRGYLPDGDDRVLAFRQTSARRSTYALLMDRLPPRWARELDRQAWRLHTEQQVQRQLAPWGLPPDGVPLAELLLLIQSAILEPALLAAPLSRLVARIDGPRSISATQGLQQGTWVLDPLLQSAADFAPAAAQQLADVQREISITPSSDDVRWPRLTFAGGPQ